MRAIGSLLALSTLLVMLPCRAQDAARAGFLVWENDSRFNTDRYYTKASSSSRAIRKTSAARSPDAGPTPPAACSAAPARASCFPSTVSAS